MISNLRLPKKKTAIEVFATLAAKRKTDQAQSIESNESGRNHQAYSYFTVRRAGLQLLYTRSTPVKLQYHYHHRPCAQEAGSLKQFCPDCSSPAQQSNFFIETEWGVGWPCFPKHFNARLKQSPLNDSVSHPSTFPIAPRPGNRVLKFSMRSFRIITAVTHGYRSPYSIYISQNNWHCPFIYLFLSDVVMLPLSYVLSLYPWTVAYILCFARRHHCPCLPRWKLCSTA